MSELPVLSISIFLPLLSALYIALFIGQSKSPRKQIYVIYVTILSAILTLITTGYILASFDSSSTSYQFVESSLLGIPVHLGIDGLSIYFIFLTALLTLICIISSLFTVKKYIKEYMICFLLLESFCLGAFSSLNLLLFFIFFEAILIPMYLIIGIWGGENRIYASIKFFLYTFLGSIFMLLAMIYIYTKTDSFDFQTLYQITPKFSFEEQKWLWLAMAFAFAIKVPMVPFHTWLPDAHVQAPTAGSVMLAGILLKFGGYAFIRILLPIFPLASKEYAIYVLWISGFAVVYGSLVALAQTDMKKMIAYSSVAHMGYVTAGIFSFSESGMQGAVFQMISHGVISSALFLIVGVLYERHHTKEIAKYGGVANVMPLMATCFMVAMLASVGLPGTSGFIGEFLSIMGTYEADLISGILCASGVILGAIYMLKLYRDVMFGEVTDKGILEFQDLELYEKFSLVPLVLLIIYIGIFPNDILNIICNSFENLRDLGIVN